MQCNNLQDVFGLKTTGVEKLPDRYHPSVGSLKNSYSHYEVACGVKKPDMKSVKNQQIWPT